MGGETRYIYSMADAARAAGKVLCHYFGQNDILDITSKGPGNYVTRADKEAETAIIKILSSAAPDFGILSEEETDNCEGNGSYRWIIDPLDGTTNFIHKIPYFCVSIALEHLPEHSPPEIVAGVIYDPNREEMFWAEKGRGAFLNHGPIRISEQVDLEYSLITTGIPRQGRGCYTEAMKMLQSVTHTACAIRCLGAAALDLAYVAAGRYDAYWHTSLKAWDMAAGILLIEQAGGIASTIGKEGNMLEKGDIIASNPTMHTQLHHILTEAE